MVKLNSKEDLFKLNQPAGRRKYGFFAAKWSFPHLQSLIFSMIYEENPAKTAVLTEFGEKIRPDHDGKRLQLACFQC
jgi:hypothetical protein